MEFLEAGVGARGCEDSQFSKWRNLKEKESLLLAAALPSVTLFCSQSKNTSSTSSRQGVRTAKVAPTRLPHGVLEAGQQWWSRGDCSEVWALPVLCKGNVSVVPDKLRSALLQEPLAPSLPPVENWCVGSRSPKQVFLAPAVFASVCLDPAK